MKIVNDITELRIILKSFRSEGLQLGLVPTMGYLHAGHLSLAQKAREENERVVVTIFVNPTQFGPQEDLGRYPKDLETDCRLLREAGADIVFTPTDALMYPDGYQTWVDVDELSRHLCGKSRPGHFRGVTTVVAKLFNIVQPDRAYFGQKDFQQARVISQMVQDLNFPIQITICPIVRESDGLAMSSRNCYLSVDDRAKAPLFYQTLKKGMNQANEKKQSWPEIIEQIKQELTAQGAFTVDYINAIDPDTLEPLTEYQPSVVLASAVFLGSTRLIDNIWNRE